MNRYRIALLCLLTLAFPAQAARVINSVTLDGGATTTVAPGSTVTVSLTVTTSGNGSNNDWDSTSYTLNGVTTCVNTPDHSFSNTYTESFTVTAPAAVGNYTISFYAHRNASCNPGSDSNHYIVTNGLVVSNASSLPTPLAEYRFDELGWIGSSGEVVDSSGNGNNGNALQTGAGVGTIVDGQICRAGTFPDVTSDTSYAVDTGLTISGSIGNSGTISIWHRSSVNWTATGTDKTLWDASSAGSDNKYFYLVLLANGTLRFGMEDSFDGDYRFETSSPISIPADTWANVTVAWDVNGSTQGQLWINGVQQTITLINNTLAGSTIGNSYSLYIGDNRSTYYPLGSARAAAGDIDEVLVFDQVLTGTEVSQIYSLQSSGQNLDGSTRVCAATPVAEYYFDDAVWNGTAGEVVDNSGNGLDGTAVNGPTTSNTTPSSAIAGNPGTCSYGDFDGNNDYVTIADNNLLDITSQLTVTAWIYPRAFPGSDLDTILSKDENYEFHVNPSNQINWWWVSSTGTHEFNSTATLSVDTWYHIAIVYTDGAQTIYVNGVAAGTASFTGTLTTNADPLLIGTDLGFVGSRNFNGAIDEVKVFDQALTATEIQVIYNETHPCSITGPARYQITAGPTAVTCEPLTVTITGVDTGGNATTIPAGTLLTVSTDLPNDGWSSPGGPGNSYSLPSDTTSVNFELRKLTPATLEIDVIDDSGRDDDDGTPDDDFVVFTDAGFIFYADGVSNSIDTQLSGKPVNVAPNAQTITIKAVQSSPADPAVCDALITNSSADIGFAYRCDSPGTCATTNDALTIDSTTVDSDSVSPYTDVNIAFDGAGLGTFTFEYQDAGMITLLAEADLPVSGSTGTANVQGNSNSFIVKPAGLCVRVTEANASCVSANANCTAFKPVDTSFDLEVRGRTWVSIGETNSDFCDDATHSDTGNFLLSNISLSSLLVQPSNGVAIAISAANTSITSNTGYVDQPLMVDEVGVLTITATPPAYFTTETIAASTSDPIGRFTPHHYVVANHSITPAISGVFTYMGQPFTAEYDIRAVDSGGTSLENYFDDGPNNDFTKLDVDTHITYGAVDSTPTYLTSRMSAAAASPSPSWGLGGSATVGQMLLVTVPLTLNRASTVAEAPLVSVAVGLEITDSDGIQLDASALDIDTELPGGPGGEDRQQIGTLTEFRFGRVFVPPVYGPEIPLDDPAYIPFVVQYWDGTAFVLSLDDSSTVYDAWTGTCSPGTISCYGSFSGAGAGAKVTNGRSDRATVNSMSIPRPGAGNVGYVFEQIMVDPWLQYDWSGTATDEDPTTQIHFGRFRGHDRIIYWREVH